MRAAVIGGAGFVGSHLVERLAGEARSVMVLDNLSTGRLENLAAARRLARVGFHSLDVDHPALPDVLERFEPEVVYLLADPCPTDKGASSPTGVAATMVARAAALCEIALRCQSRIVLAVPGVDLYGIVAQQPVRESQRPHPIHPFGASLYAALRYVEARLGPNWCGLPMGVVYGPRQQPEQSVVAWVAHEMLRGRTPTVHGTTEVARDYVFVEDAVDALVRAGEQGRGLVNVGTGTATPNSDLVAALSQACGYSGGAEYIHEHLPHPQRLALDASVAAARLGWKPWTSLREGLEKTVRWLQEGASSSSEPGQL